MIKVANESCNLIDIFFLNPLLSIRLSSENMCMTVIHGSAVTPPLQFWHNLKDGPPEDVGGREAICH